MIQSKNKNVLETTGTLWVGGAADILPTDPQTIQAGLVKGANIIKWEATHAD